MPLDTRPFMIGLTRFFSFIFVLVLLAFNFVSMKELMTGEATLLTNGSGTGRTSVPTLPK